MEGANYLREQSLYKPSSLSQQVAFELQNCAERIGGEFEPAAAALWLLQNVMMMRLSVEGIRRSYNRRPLALTEDQTRQIGGDAEFLNLIQRLNDRQSSKIEDNDLMDSVSQHYDEQPWFEKPDIIPNALDLERRMLTVFHGGVVIDLKSEDDERRYGYIQSLAAWIGRLRRTGEAILTEYIASSIMDVLDGDTDSDEIWIYTGERGDSSSLLEAMLPQVGWQALIDAADHLSSTPHPLPFMVSYALVGPEQPRPSGVVDIGARQVTLIGPLLMLPLKAAERWSELVRSVPDIGLYAVPAP